MYKYISSVENIYKCKNIFLFLFIYTHTLTQSHIEYVHNYQANQAHISHNFKYPLRVFKTIFIFYQYFTIYHIILM